jgi:hypothetical protein
MQVLAEHAVASTKVGVFVLREIVLFFRHPVTKVCGFSSLQFAAHCEQSTKRACPKLGKVTVRELSKLLTENHRQSCSFQVTALRRVRHPKKGSLQNSHYQGIALARTFAFSLHSAGRIRPLSPSPEGSSMQCPLVLFFISKFLNYAQWGVQKTGMNPAKTRAGLSDLVKTI